jgi:G:T-mismatch repair DNA endonuclease (very short patch repair protein)
VRKITRNREHDTIHLAALDALGWKALIIWECETRKSEEFLQKLVDFLDQPETVKEIEGNHGRVLRTTLRKAQG